ncbi:hypothetical protein EDB84DRAFT_339261 [Lactarius hengduanensis]|nr:hypothetical protein EDB84DRAFT_339261 [Lactarius hengduanensis]
MKTRPSASASARSSSRSSPSPRTPGSPPCAAAGPRARCCRARRCADRYPHQGNIQNLRGGRGEDILLFLPSFNDGRPTRCGNEFVHLLLARATSALREDLAPGRNPASLEQYPPIPRQERLLRVRLGSPFIIPHAAQLSQPLRSVREIRQSTGSAHDTMCVGYLFSRTGDETVWH